MKDERHPIDMVREFHEYSGHPVGDKPKLLDWKRAIERAEYIRSEIDEFLTAVAEGNLDEAADALDDAEYFIHGTRVEMGITKEHAAERFSEVHRANMTKFCETEDDAWEAVRLYRAGEHPQSPGKEFPAANYRLHEGRWIIYDMRTGKILKSHKTEKPNTILILNRHL